MAAAVWGLTSCQPRTAAPGDADWSHYGGSPEGQRFSELKQITRENVQFLREEWRFETGLGGIQTQPLVIAGRLFGYTPTQKIFALDARTGKKIWRFDPGPDFQQPARGFAYWTDGRQERLFASYATFLLALDPSTGRLIKAFGKQGRVDLREGLGREPEELATYLTTPGIVYKDLIITGFRTAETLPAAPGAIRAYDVRTGRLVWTFNLVPRPGEPGHETWPEDAWTRTGGVNAWAGFALDDERGIVYAPTGSPAFDFFGGDRKGDNLYANSLVALDAATGAKLWHFQAVHHDIWDYDLPSPPVLLDVTRDGKVIPAVAQTTKHGFIFVFDRVTGEPLFPIEELPAPPSDVAGEYASPTQPVPTAPAPFARQGYTPEILTDRTPEARAFALETAGSLHTGPLFTPLTLGTPSTVVPSFDGGAEWGGPAVDPATSVLYVNSNEWISLGGLASLDPGAHAGEQVYMQSCAGCHGAQLQGAPPQFPSLEGVAERLDEAELRDVIANGKGRMPGFPSVRDSRLDELISYLRNPDGAGSLAGRNELAGSGAASALPYVFTGYNELIDAEGYPAIKPPWGTLNAVNLTTGEYLWRLPLGEHPQLVERGLPETGSKNYGGPIVTAGGLLFIGATVFDRKFRAFNAATGELLWESPLPYAGVATPATYKAGGRQYVVIAASGSRDPTGPQGSAYVAFALPPQLSSQGTGEAP